jgi:hypothetical protein
MKRLLHDNLNPHSWRFHLICIGCLSLLFLILVKHSDSAIAQSNTATPKPTASSLGNDQEAGSNNSVDEQGLGAIKLYESNMRAELYRHNFKGLEEIATELRRTRPRFPGGSWKLNTFYWALAMPTSGDKTNEPEWTMHLNNLQRWVDEHPDSLTAHIALGDAYVNYAWNARGRGYANKVSEDGWQLFQRRLATAKGFLDKAGTLPGKCPHRYVALETLAMGAGFDSEYVDKVFNEGIALEPNYQYLYAAKANYLLPRWHGSEGQMEQFAEQTLQRVGGKQGSALYYLIAENVGPLYRSKLFHQTQLSWPKIQQGFRDLESEYGMNDHRLNQYCRLAGWANDMTTSQQMLQRIGDRWDESVWGTQDYFEDFKAWAFTSSWKYRGLQWSFPVIILASASLIIYRRYRRYKRRRAAA